MLMCTYGRCHLGAMLDTNPVFLMIYFFVFNNFSEFFTLGTQLYVLIKVCA